MWIAVQMWSYLVLVVENLSLVTEAQDLASPIWVAMLNWLILGWKAQGLSGL